jgi:hypothetical protein
MRPGHDQRWHDAEAKIYPLVMVDAAGYEAAVEAVARVVDLLRLEAHDIEALRSISAEPLPTLSRAGVEQEQLPGSLTAAIVVDAACATRQREIAAESLARRRASQATAARGRGDTWVELADDDGRLARHGVPELLVELESGRAVQTALTVDPQTAEPVLLLMPVTLDLSSGGVSAVGGVATRTIRCDRAAWRVAVAELFRQLLDTRDEVTIYRLNDPSNPPEG